MALRIEVLTLTEDGRAKTLENQFKESGKNCDTIRIIDVYTVEEDIEDLQDIEHCLQSFTNPVTQKAFVLKDGQKPANDYYDVLGDFDWALEIGYLPGVTDNIGSTASELTALTLKQEKTLFHFFANFSKFFKTLFSTLFTFLKHFLLQFFAF